MWRNFPKLAAGFQGSLGDDKAGFWDVCGFFGIGVPFDGSPGALCLLIGDRSGLGFRNDFRKLPVRENAESGCPGKDQTVPGW